MPLSSEALLSSLTYWLPAIFSTTVIGIVGAIVGPIYKSRIERGIQSKFDRKLELFRSQLRTEEEAVRSAFKVRDEQIASLRSGALAAASDRQILLQQKKINAVETVWTVVKARPQLKALARMSQRLDLKEMAKIAANDDRDGLSVREFADHIWNLCGMNKMEIVSVPEKERLYISLQSWALYSAYSQVLGYSAAYILAAKTGVGDGILKDSSEILEILKLALPNHQSYIEKYSDAAIPHLVDELEERLLAQLRSELDDTSSDHKAVVQAAEILRAVQKVEIPRSEGPEPPGPIKASSNQEVPEPA